MQCTQCKRWYAYALDEDSPTQGWGCAAFVTEDGKRLQGTWGSVTLDGFWALITKPGALPPGTVVCDWCYLEGEARGDYVPQGDLARWHHPPLVVPPELRDNPTVHVMENYAGHLMLLCTFQERWVLRLSYGTWEPKDETRIECLGHPERSDVTSTDEILEHPEVEAFRLFIDGIAKTKENT